jgi:broad specificity phosphatase PhoE
VNRHGAYSKSREAGPLRPSDGLSEAGVREIVERFRSGEPKHRLAVEHGMSMSTIKRLLRKHRGRLLQPLDILNGSVCSLFERPRV